MTRHPDPSHPARRSPYRVDLTGSRFGTYVAVHSLDRLSPDGSVAWLCRCSCGAECEFSVTRLRRYERDGLLPHCGCADYATAKAELRLRRPRKERIGLPRNAYTTPKSNRHCWQCCGLAHRVEGKACATCGLAFAPEPPIAFEVPGLSSSAGRALDFGITGLDGFRTKRRVA